MNSIHIKKHHKLYARDEQELQRQIEALRRQVLIRSGSVLHIRQLGSSSRAPCSASVHYELPLHRASIGLDWYQPERG